MEAPRLGECGCKPTNSEVIGIDDDALIGPAMNAETINVKGCTLASLKKPTNYLDQLEQIQRDNLVMVVGKRPGLTGDLLEIGRLE